MTESVDELTIHYEEDGRVLRKEVAKEVLSKGSWATIMYLYQDLDRKTGEYGQQKVSIRRYQKREGTFCSAASSKCRAPLKRARSAIKFRTGFPKRNRSHRVGAFAPGPANALTSKRLRSVLICTRSEALYFSTP